MSRPSLWSGSVDTIRSMARDLAREISALPMPERVEALNVARRELHAASPFADQPVDCVLWVEADAVHGNDYNPNTVAPPEMRLLELSIRNDGYTQPIVAWRDADSYEVVDGFHRRRVGMECRAVRDRVHGYLPLAVVNNDRQDRRDRIAATIRHNRARGVHGVVPMADIVAELIRQGWDDEDVARQLGMDADEVLRFKQSTGLPELFKDIAFSRAWHGEGTWGETK